MLARGGDPERKAQMTEERESADIYFHHLEQLNA